MTHTQSPDSPFKRILRSIGALVQARVELISIELTEEKNRLFAAFFGGLIALLFGIMALVTLTALVVLVCWETYRWQALAGLGCLYLIIAIICALRTCAQLRRAPLLLETTLAEFKKDREAFKKTS